MDNEVLKERRKYERFPFIEDILIDGTRMSTSMDISEGGLYISAMQPYEENSFIDISIPFKGENLAFKAQVRHCQPGIGMGVMFVDVTAEQRNTIKELIETIMGKTVQSAAEGRNILLIEDSDTTRQAIKNALRKEGFNVIEAMDGIAAMKFIAEEKLHLIILDLYMSGMDGLKVLSVLKTTPQRKEIPVIVCSGHDTQDIKDKVMNAGANEFISKRGTSPAKLVQSVKALLQRHHKP